MNMINWLRSFLGLGKIFGVQTYVPGVTVECVETGAVYADSKLASCAMDLRHDVVKTAIRKSRKAAGYHWRYLDV